MYRYMLYTPMMPRDRRKRRTRTVQVTRAHTEWQGHAAAVYNVCWYDENDDDDDGGTVTYPTHTKDNGAKRARRIKNKQVKPRRHVQRLMVRIYLNIDFDGHGFLIFVFLRIRRRAYPSHTDRDVAVGWGRPTDI